MVIFQFLNINKFNQDKEIFHSLLTSWNFWTPFLVHLTIALALSVAVSGSIRSGKWLRFFFIGFFLYGVILTFSGLPVTGEMESINGS